MTQIFANESLLCGDDPCNDWELPDDDNVSIGNETGLVYGGWMYQHDKLKYSVEGVATLCIGIFGVVGNVFTLLTLARQVEQTTRVNGGI